MDEIENAKITYIKWDRERGLTMWIGVDGSGWGGALGGYSLSDEACAIWMNALMETFSLWELDESKLIGRVVRVKHSGVGGHIIAIGDAIEDKWLEPKVLFAKFIKEK